MSLYRIWKADPKQLDDLRIEQIVALAGTELKDESSASVELRRFLSEVTTGRLVCFVDELLGIKFDRGGYVFQDLVNELGRRLEYQVENGRYQGRAGLIGFDGIWAVDGSELVIEVKTTDAYRINLDTLNGYRESLIKAGRLSASSSMLYVVGRQDTGELESQVRGSKHAWTTRIISAEALCKLVLIKERANSDSVLERIKGVLRPVEFTRLDDLVEILFSTAEDAQHEEPVAESEVVREPREIRRQIVRTAERTIESSRIALAGALSKVVNKRLLARTRGQYWSADRQLRATIAVSKRYGPGQYPYWYAFHDHQHRFLCEGAQSYLLLGCTDLAFGFAVPFSILKQNLSALNTTARPESDRSYWHIRVFEPQPGEFAILLPKADKPLPITEFKTPVLELA